MLSCTVIAMVNWNVVTMISFTKLAMVSSTVIVEVSFTLIPITECNRKYQRKKKAEYTRYLHYKNHQVWRVTESHWSPKLISREQNSRTRVSCQPCQSSFMSRCLKYQCPDYVIHNTFLIQRMNIWWIKKCIQNYLFHFCIQQTLPNNTTTSSSSKAPCLSWPAGCGWRAPGWWTPCWPHSRVWLWPCLRLLH